MRPISKNISDLELTRVSQSSVGIFEEFLIIRQLRILG